VKKSLAAFALSFVALALPATDNFNRTDSGTLGANWTVAQGGTSAGVTSNRLAGQESGATDGLQYWNADSFSANQYAQLVNISPGATGYLGPAVCVASGKGIYAYFDDSEIYEMTGGVRTDIGNRSSNAMTANDLLYIEVNGTAVDVKENGVSVGTATTSLSCSSTSAGIVHYSTTNQGDDWEGGDLGGATPSFIKAIINAPIRGGGWLFAPLR
jgi:hypothetical protein